MKFILLSALFTISSLSVAGETLIHEKLSFKYDKWELNSTRYRVNPENGTAWIKMYLLERGPEDYDWETVKVEVPGMALVDNEIVFNDVVCASIVVRTNKILINPTGNCTFSQVQDKIQISVGDRVKKKRRLRVYLNTNN